MRMKAADQIHWKIAPWYWPKSTYAKPCAFLHCTADGAATLNLASLNQWEAGCRGRSTNHGQAREKKAYCSLLYSKEQKTHDWRLIRKRIGSRGFLAKPRRRPNVSIGYIPMPSWKKKLNKNVISWLVTVQNQIFLSSIIYYSIHTKEQLELSRLQYSNYNS